MMNDPIVEEIHRVRAQMISECAGDFEKYFDRIRTAEAQDHQRLVSPEEFRRRKEASRK